MIRYEVLFCEIKEKGRYFECLFINSKIYNEYKYIRNQIRKNFTLYQDIIEKLLVSLDQSLALNSARLLNRFSPDLYPSPNYLEIINNLQLDSKINIFNYFRKIVSEISLSWEQRENIITICQFLDLNESLDFLKFFLDDPEVECRISLAKALKNHRSPEGQEILLKLLLDSSEEVRYTAGRSLGQILPGIHRNSSPSEILIRINPHILLKNIKLENMTQFEKYIWRQKGFDPLILEKNAYQSNEVLIQNYVMSVFKMTSSEKSSYLLLFNERIPIIIEVINSYMQEIINQSEKEEMLQLMELLHNKLYISSSDEFNILL